MKKYSEAELIQHCFEQVFNLNFQSTLNTEFFDSYADYSPFWIHLNCITDLSLKYFNKTALRNFDESMDEIKEEGVRFLQKIIHPESAQYIIPLKKAFIKTGNEHRVIAFEQRIKYSKTSDYRNHLCFSTLNKKLRSTLTLTLPVNYLEAFVQKRIFNESEIFNKYYEGFNSLTEREKEVLKLISDGKSNIDISRKLYISSLTVKTHRQNIIKKLQTNNITDLTKIAVYFNLIN